MYDTQITLTGWIGGEVTLREVGEHRQVASFRVACTPTRYRDGEWVKGTTTWHTVKAWNRLGRHVVASLSSGDPVVVHGRLVADVWERDGKPQTSWEVVASAVGHDLTHGTTTFAKPAAPAVEDERRATVPTAAPVVASDAAESVPDAA